MTCTRCGAPLLPGAQFCGSCGAQVGASQNQSTPPESMTAGRGINIDDDAKGTGRGYSYEILHQPSYSLAVVELQAEQSILAEAGAMVSMSANIELQSQM